MGLYIFYFNYRQVKNLTAALKYSPSGDYKKEFEKNIIQCRMDPERVALRYGYSNEMIATAMLGTVNLDPLLWNTIENDPEAQTVKDILKVHVFPTLSEIQKQRIARTQEILSPGAQRFIFKHELAHVHYNYSIKKLCVLGTIGILSTWLAISVSVLLLPVQSLLALLGGLFVGGVSDLLLTYCSNVLFTSREEKNADLFAAQHSNVEDIEAAAQFFEKLQQIRDATQEVDNLFAKLPSLVATGHYHGKVRACYLRAFLAKSHLL